MIERLAPRILIPNAVIEELRAGDPKDPTAAAAVKWATAFRVDDIESVVSIAH